MNKIIQDMIPTKRKPPLREVIPMERDEKSQEQPHIKKKPTERKKPERPAYSHIDESEDNIDRVMPRGIVGSRTVKPWLFAVIAFVCLAAIVFGFSIVYAKATVTIIPASIDIPINGSYVAYKNATASGTLAYQIIQTNSQLSQNVPATLGKAVITTAIGNVILYNNYGTASQKIVAGTRLMNGNGLIYTTNTAVIIPGITKGNVAGSVVVGVTASMGGSAYNILPTDLTTNPSYGDFTIVAYKGTAKYSGFYARLNPSGNGITDGSSGNQITTSSTTVAAAQGSMRQSLQTSLLSQAQTMVPVGYIMFSNAYSINYTPIAASSTGTTTASVGMQATFTGILFKKTDLAATLAPTQYNATFDPQDLESAQFTITNPQTFSAANGTPLTFNLVGNLNLVGIISTSTLASQLTGISLAQSPAIFNQYKTISSAHAIIVPFWKRSFPSSPLRISIVTQSQ